MSEKYVYQHSAHKPPWAISYEVEYLRRGIKVYLTLYSEVLDNARNAVVFDLLAFSAFNVAHQLQSHCHDRGIKFTDEDFNQIEWEFKRYFK